MDQKFYDFTAKSLDSETIKMDKYKGKTVLVVNTASKCGFTPQYEGLETLYEKYKNRDFVILGFPCNQFANQEPGDASSIAQGCVLDYSVTFPMFDKIKVNGPNAHPLFKYLENALGGLGGSRIKWNFTKFLIDANGRPVKRFAPATAPEKIDKYVKKLVKQV